MLPSYESRSRNDWPATREALIAGRELLSQALPGPFVIACDHDVDGLASAVLVARAIQQLGGTTELAPVGRGQHVHETAYRSALAQRRAAAYVVTDMGSRAEPIGLPAPTLLIDHHDAGVFPPDAVVVSAARRDPVAPTSYLAFELLRDMTAIDQLDWLALLGSVADLGAAANFGAIPSWRKRYRSKHVTEAIALLNAARRAPEHDVRTALRVLSAADSPQQIAASSSPEVLRLREYRAVVAEEVKRALRVGPRMHGNVAVVRIRSRAQVHPLVAVRWKSRFAGKVVLVANDDYLPGRVNFVVRSAGDLDLLAWLRSLPFESSSPDFARGHPAATGGSLTPAEFDQLLKAIDESEAAGS
jgi:single-stranded DNA-specific DHH superfamily exonuclease